LKLKYALYSINGDVANSELQTKYYADDIHVLATASGLSH